MLLLLLPPPPPPVVVVVVVVVLENEHWYKHAQKSVETTHESIVTVLGNQVKSDTKIPNNKPKITIHNN
jgi:hypothetical protein